MADEKLEQTADKFRRAVQQAAEHGRLKPAGVADAGSTAPVDPDAIVAALDARLSETLTAAVRQEIGVAVAAAVRESVADALAQQPSADAAAIDPDLIVRLEAAAERIAEKDDGDVLLHLRNILPGQIRQELHQQNQTTVQRLSTIEAELDAIQANNGVGWQLLRLALIGLVVFIIAVFVAIFEKQLQNWGRDSIYPLLGLSIKEASPSSPRSASPAAPQERR